MKPKGFLPAGILFAAAFFSLFYSAQVSGSSFIGVDIPFSDSAENSAVASDEQKIFVLVNRERSGKGLNNLLWYNDLAGLARSYSEKMATGNFFSHFESDGSNVADRARTSRIKGWNKIGENLFFCFGVREYDHFAVENWMKSEMHRRNILDADYTATGIGLARSREGKIYLTQVFIKD